ncbi:hypothetical protein [Nonomuraea sp. NPDC050786]|uniref:hypothetical protein n=1 Tax=Nonomuraea sp. NPDC050786 TaxID=3154840 RepID=UPI0033CE985A
MAVGAPVAVGPPDPRVAARFAVARPAGVRHLHPRRLNGGPALLVRINGEINGEIDGVLAMRLENGYVTGVSHVRIPEKSSRVERETAVSR